jgi:hypothetical protein
VQLGRANLVAAVAHPGGARPPIPARSFRIGGRHDSLASRASSVTSIRLRIRRMMPELDAREALDQRDDGSRQ